MAAAGAPCAARAGDLAMLGVGAGPEGSATGDADGFGGDWSGAGAGRGAGGRRSPMPRADRDAIAVLLSVHGLGPLTLGRLVASLGSPAAILDVASGSRGGTHLVVASRSDDGEARPMPLVVAEAVVTAAAGRARILAEIEREGLRVVAQGDAEYPARLLAVDLPPPALFVRGTLMPLATDHVVGVVGTRRPSPEGRRLASRIGTALARAEATVVSGLAVGIDGAAHAAAVAEQRPTIAFIGGGHGRLFPRAHDRLADAIVEGGGAVVSEYAPMVEPSRGTFPQRNRLISGTSDAVVVVEAGASSGALLTASWALEQGRECFLVPGSIDSPTSAGCNGFLREWAGAARIVSGIPQLLDDLGLFGGAALEGLGDARRPASPGGVVISSRLHLPTVRSVLSGRSEAEQEVGEALVHGVVTVDELVAVTRRSLAEVLRSLTRLEAGGLVHATRGRYEPLGALAGSSPSPSRPKAA
jgi:DNA processing protein